VDTYDLLGIHFTIFQNVKRTNVFCRISNGKIINQSNGHSTTITSFQTGAAIKFECNPGYKSGNIRLICHESGHWAPPKGHN
jgi:hypothetical protein